MKDILVQLDGSERSSCRLDVAASLAQRFGSRLLGLFAQTETNLPSLVARRPSEALKAAAEQCRQMFEDRIAAAGITGKWWQLGHGEPGHVVSETVFCARYADLVILGQWHSDPPTVPEEMVEQVILQSGRPVLIIPHVGDVSSVGQRVSIAWNGSREATRALHDALPLLNNAIEVNILAVREPDGTTLPAGVPEVDIVDHLTARGIKARAERLTAEDIGVMDLLLSRAFDIGSDLLVMGAHSGLGLSFLRGAGTRFMLRHMTMPVLMSN